MAAQKRVDNKRRILKEGESQLPDGRYRYRYFDMDGCRQVVYSWKLVERDRMPPGKKDDLSLREKERQIERDMEDSIKTGRDAKITLNQMFETYMTGKISLKQSTRTNYIYMYTHYVQDGFGKKMLKDIRYSDVKAFYNSLIVEKGFKANSMEIINTLIHPALTLAVRDGYIRFNPSDGVMMEIKKSHQWEKTHRHALTIEEQSAFLNYIASNEQYKHWLPMFTLFLGTGCRVGEIVGLRWEDCDFKQRIININHTLIYRLQDDGRVEYHITTPKTEAGIREIPMMDEGMCRAILLSERHLQHFENVGEEIEREVSDFIGVMFDICHDTAQGSVFQGLHGCVDKQINVHIRHLLLGLVALVCLQLAFSGNLLSQRIPAAQIELLPFLVHLLLYSDLIFRIVVVDDLGELCILELILVIIQPKSRVCQIHARRSQKLCLVIVQRHSMRHGLL